MEKGKVLKLRDLNAGFTRPDTISLAYYEASLLVDHIVRTYGEGALRDLVRSFSGGVDTETAITRTLKVSIDDLQTGFDRSLDQRFGAMRRALHDAPSLSEGMPVDALKAAAAAHPESYVAQLALGEALAGAGDAAAYAPLEKAAALVPPAIGPESPHAIMAGLAEKLGDKERARREYEAIVAIDHTNVEAARKLAALGKETKDARASSLGLDRVVALDPFDADAHSALGRVALAGKDTPTAVREFRAALQASPADKAAAHTDLGEAYLAAGRPEDAKKEALAALEIAPTFDRAQELLLNAIAARKT
jgi:tetratricopeptide (TPR) repeat protein